MEWFGMHEVFVLMFGLWLFTTVGILPRAIENPKALAITSLVVGSILAWLVSLGAGVPWAIMAYIIMVVASTVVARIVSEMHFRKKYGYWRWIGK